MTDEDNTRIPDDSALNIAPEQSAEYHPSEENAFVTLRFDLERYQRIVRDHDLNENQQQQYLAALWQIMVCVGDLAFGFGSFQIVSNEEGVVEVDSPAVLILNGISDTTSGLDAVRPEGAPAEREDSR